MKFYLLTFCMLCFYLLIIAQPSLNKNSSSPVSSSGYIRVYFNHTVDTTVATGEHAHYIFSSVDDTLVAYINKAKYTIDIAVYNYIQSSSILDIAGAINNAYSKGVRIRWIYNSSSSNSGLSGLNPAIPTLESPSAMEYGIMHNKFMVIDANSEDISEPIVWTGSCNWNSGQMNYDVNNIVILQDKSLAQAFTSEFNEMWGDTGALPNLLNSHFGPYKTNNTQHIFTIDGKTVECYFSPSDNTNDYILNSINSANSEIYFGVYTFTLNDDAYAIANKIQNQGVYAAGIIDSYSDGFAPYNILKPIMGNMLKVYTNSSGSIYHDKLVIVDPCDYSSDPLVETGSHNWTFSANTINDENTLIIHDSTITNMYYQSFRQNFKNLFGTLNACTTTGIDDPENISSVKIYPSPASDNLQVNNLNDDFENIILFDLAGKNVFRKNITKLENVNINLTNLSDGIYFITLEGKNKLINRKIIIQHQ